MQVVATLAWVLVLCSSSAALAQPVTRCGGGGPTQPGRRGPLSAGAAADEGLEAPPSTLASLPYFKQPSSEVVAALRALPSDDTAQASIERAASESSSSSDVLLQPKSICDRDPPFLRTNYSRTTCRLVVNSLRYGTTMCTAWFITAQHVATAGHCVATKRRYQVDPKNPGYLCCAFDDEDNVCLTTHKWKLQKWVTTTGWFENQMTNNDGAVIKVLPWVPGNNVGGVPQPIASFYPARIPEGDLFLDGFPGRANDDVGCYYSINDKKRYYTQATVRPLNKLVGGENATAVSYPLAGCMGESGGRVLFGGDKGGAFGLQTFGATDCYNNRGSTGVTQITSTLERCGVCLECLAAAIR